MQPNQISSLSVSMAHILYQLQSKTYTNKTFYQIALFFLNNVVLSIVSFFINYFSLTIFSLTISSLTIFLFIIFSILFSRSLFFHYFFIHYFLNTASRSLFFHSIYTFHTKVLKNKKSNIPWPRIICIIMITIKNKCTFDIDHDNSVGFAA